MAVSPWCVFLLLLSVWAPSASHSRETPPPSEPAGGRLESSGDGPLYPRHGPVKAVRPGPALAARSGLFRREPSTPHGGGGGGPRLPFPAFLSRGRAGPAGGPGGALPAPRREKVSLEAKKRQGLQMWQQAVSKERHQGKVSLALSLKDARQQTCSAIPYPQRVTAEGCEAVTVRNKLCFGQCSSLFVPTGGPEEAAAGAGARRGGCSRCSPSRTHAAPVALRCGPKGGLLERQVMVVDECRCEAGSGELL